MKNVSQTINFPVSALTPTKLADDVNELAQQLRIAKSALEARNENTTPEEAEVLTNKVNDVERQLRAGLTPENLKELAFFGASLPIDGVLVSMRLGNVFFDLYQRMTPEPTAPLQKAIHKKRGMELAELLDKDEFELPSYAVPALRKALMDETFWDTVSLHVWVDLPAETPDAEKLKRFFTINSKGTIYFTDVLTAAAEALYTDELLKA
jgi:hypothetical protein